MAARSRMDYLSLGVGGRPPNTRLKLTAPVVCGRLAFVNVKAWRRSLRAIR